MLALKVIGFLRLELNFLLRFSFPILLVLLAGEVGVEPTHNDFRDRRATFTLLPMAAPLGFEPRQPLQRE